MVDDYAGYKAMLADGPTDLACLAHIRRKFFDTHASGGSHVAEQLIHRIGKLYAIEQQSARLDPPKRKLLRGKQAIPALVELYDRLITGQRTVAAGSDTAKAINHALERWPALQRYVRSGSLPMDNNSVEHHLFDRHRQEKLAVRWFGTGWRAAAIHSLFATAKLNGLDPVRWLADTLEQLPTYPNNRTDSFRPFANSTGN